MFPGFPVKSCAILTSPLGDIKQREISRVLDTLVPALEKYDCRVTTFINAPIDEIANSDPVDIFVVLGGDGTMIHFAGPLSNLNTPFYGLNYGNVGFMMNNPNLGLLSHAKRLACGDFLGWDFPILSVRATDLKGCIHEGVGLNDIYIQRMTPQTCKIEIKLNNEALPIDPILCDGVIVATPLGSTAYSYNVTGALAAIDAPVISLTLMAAARSCPVHALMLPLHTRFKFEVLEPEKRRAMLVSDGLSQGDLTHAEVALHPRKVRLCFDQAFEGQLPLRFIHNALRR